MMMGSVYAEDAKKLPRFAALKTNDVNVRVGPGENFPIKFSFHRQFWPVKITREFDDWRKIMDKHRNEGWVHRRTLCGKTYVLVLKKSILLKSDDLSSPPIARIDKDVHVLLKKCDPIQCKIEVAYQGKVMKGWVEKKNLWGVPIDEQ